MIYNVTDYGVMPGQSALQTEAIQAVIDLCYRNGGGEVRLPTGTYRAAGLMLRSGVTLHLMENTVLEGSHDPVDYEYYLHDEFADPEDGTFSPLLPCSDDLFEKPARISMTTARSPWHKAMIRAIRANDVAVIGEEGSAIDGVDCYDPHGENNYRGPHGIDFFQCRNIMLRGYTVRNCGNWAHILFFCENIRATNLKVTGGHDGFHVRSCDNILLQGADIRSGDDAVAGFDNNNMIVRDCYLNSACNAVRSAGCNVLFENCVMEGPGDYVFRGSLKKETQEKSLPTDENGRYNMLTGWCYFGDDSFIIRQQPSNITLSNCKIIGADRMIHYNYSGSDPWHSNRPLANLTLRNVVGEGIGMPLVLYGDKELPIDITLDNVHITFCEGYPAEDCMYLCNYRKLSIHNVSFSGTTGDKPIIRRWNGNNGEITAENGKVEDIAVIADTDRPFSCDRF